MNSLAVTDIGRPASAASTVLVALGGNLASAAGGPRQTLEAALTMMPALGLWVRKVAPFYRTPSLSTYIQDFYVNSVAEIETALPPKALLAALHRIEALFGRVRRDRWGPRVLDLDLLDCRGLIVPAVGRRGPDAGAGPLPLALPHPAIAERAFVLLPLRDVAPGWRHPVTGESVDALIRGLAADAMRGIERFGG
ncbi:MAG: 2-amino-4-hydroxy-6-hydroxymethyldihydropteridine diphosphokinase [Alphaproteobacteria bacterium HGW-Alphaproteobacteria-11]|nr:MAG: 2-amino-4-hydroxy-6-hydroxymethyldihydropteridine diphosphokinase [Alphaproteobacteria bacterium HGW-Alphaproteobacteria-11]